MNMLKKQHLASGGYNSFKLCYQIMTDDNKIQMFERTFIGLTATKNKEENSLEVRYNKKIFNIYGINGNSFEKFTIQDSDGTGLLTYTMEELIDYTDNLGD